MAIEGSLYCNFVHKKNRVKDLLSPSLEGLLLSLETADSRKQLYASFVAKDLSRIVHRVLILWFLIEDRKNQISPSRSKNLILFVYINQSLESSSPLTRAGWSHFDPW